MPFTEGLPRSDRNDELQELSLNALKNALPVSQWLLREEMKDKGLDVSIELKMNGQCTNLRVQVQLKSCETADDNADGSVSYAVPVHNFKYLLNGSSGLYILFVASRNELRYLWARDERQRVESLNDSWTSQENLTLRFRHLLTAQALEDIAERLQREARLNEKIHASLIGVGLGEPTKMVIDPATLEAANPAEVQAVLLSCGLSLVTGGFGEGVLNAVGLLSSAQHADPRIQLVCAYACLTLTRYFDAAGHVARVLLRRQELSEDDQEFADFLRCVCDFQTGRIDLEEYARREQQWRTKATSAYALGLRLEVARHRLPDAFALRQPEEHLAELTGIAQGIFARQDVSDAFKLQARLFLLYSEGAVAAGKVFQSILIAQKRAQKINFDLISQLSELGKPLLEWEDKIATALEEAEASQSLLLRATAYDVRATTRILHLCHLRMCLVYAGREPLLPEGIIYPAMFDAENARQLYKATHRLEGEMRATIQLADLHEIANWPESARQLAEQALPQCQAMAFTGLETRAQAHISGQTVLQRFEINARRNYETQGDYQIASASAEEISHMAVQVLERLGLPADRLPLLQKEVAMQQVLARERLSWCRHLELFQQGNVSENVDGESGICGSCKLHQYESPCAMTDWRAVISTFKSQFCKGCPDKSPVEIG
jgi:hypothetical protein